MWRVAQLEDEASIVEMCLALYAEDPGEPITEAQVRRTLDTLRHEPTRGRVLVAARGGDVVGYALLVSFWSNENGGEICTIDELYVRAAFRGEGLSTKLFKELADARELWPVRPVALELEVTPSNARARAFYERLGFSARNATLRRRV